jgi:hypothetical protein
MAHWILTAPNRTKTPILTSTQTHNWTGPKHIHKNAHKLNKTPLLIKQNLRPTTMAYN